MRIILGSASPRRRMILGEIFGDIETIAPSVDESRSGNESPEIYAERITNLKMDQVLKDAAELNDAMVLTSDTIVTIDGLILGKPESVDDAVFMLRTLSGREHSVITGLSLAVVRNGAASRFYDCEITIVRFKDIGDDVINKYIGSVNCLDKAGSYAIQERGELIIDSVQGSVTNVIGLPLRLFYRLLCGTGVARDLL